MSCRHGFAVAIGLLAGLSAYIGPAVTSAMARPLDLEATALRMTGGWVDAFESRGSPITPIGGFLLRSSDPDFGGLSGLMIEGDRARFVSDKGFWVEAGLTRDSMGRIRQIEGLSIEPLIDGDGKPVRGWRRDAESLARDPSGAVWIGFERVDRVVAYEAPDRPPVAEAAQLPTLGLAHNQGIEALAIAPDGALIAIAESAPEEPGLPQEEWARRYVGWRMIAGTAQAFQIVRSDGFSATGADLGPDGALYLLERRFGFLTGVAMRLRRFPDIQARLSRGETALGQGETLMVLGGDAPIDNMEGVSVERGADGALLIAIVSDDNYNAFQNTVLLQFRLQP